MGAFEFLQHTLDPTGESPNAIAADMIFGFVTGMIGVYVAMSRQEMLVNELSREVGERKKADDAVAILSKAVEQSADKVLITDTKGILSYVNQEFERRTGYTKEEVIGQSTRLLNSGKQGPDFYEDLWATILSGNIHRRVLVNKAKNGQLFYEDQTITPIRDAGGNITHFVSTARDITERIAMEDSLHKRQKALQSVYQISITGGTSLEEVCGQVALNLAELLGFSRVAVHQFLGTQTKTLAVAVNGRLVREEVGTENIVSSNEQNAAVSSLPGVWQVNRDHFSIPLRDKSGNVGRIVASARDKQALSQDDSQLLEIFGSYVAHEIERANLETQLDSTRETQLLGQVAAGISHEMRNPLAAVLAITEVMCRDLKDNPAYAQHLAHMRSVVNSLSVLMQELLDLGKPLKIEGLKLLSLPELCSDAIKLWKQYVPQRKHEVVLTEISQDGDLRIMAESNRFYQVLINLLENASQHSPEEKEIRLILEAYQHPDSDQKRVRVQVVDRGSGIPEQNIRRVFQPFFTTRAGGTGLGMTVVKRIVELYGGSISITNNQPPPGCTVQVDFPMAPEDHNETQHSPD